MSYWKNMVARYSSTESNVDDVRMDRVTNTLQTIEYEHHEIHSGSSYVFTVAGDIANNDYAHLLVVTPNTPKWGHIIFEAEVETEMKLNVCEGVSISDSGTSLSSYNRNRNSTNEPAILVYTNPTITDSGTCIVTAQVGSGKKIGGSARSTGELILKENTIYDFKVRNESGGAGFASQQFNWYEHTNKH